MHRNIMKVLPGLLLCFVVMMLGIYGAELIGVMMKQMNVIAPESNTPISGIFVAIIIGMIVRNVFGLKEMFTFGMNFSVKRLLRFGIILLGLRLSLVEAVKLGALGIPLIIACIASGFFLTIYLTKKLQQSTRLGMLIATGTGICGVTAIMATAPVLKAKDNEISYAVANITIFGLTGMVLYPLLANFLFGDDPIKTGMFLGTAIHDTAQVTGAALIHAQMFQMDDVIDVATVTKLTRNLFIIVMIPLVSFLYFKGEGTNKGEKVPKWYTFIPLFVIGFLCLSLIRTIGDATLDSTGAAFGMLNTSLWEMIYTKGSNFGTTYLLGMAMAGVGLSTDFWMLKGIGWKPFYIGLTAALTVGFVSALLISLFGGFVQM
ncbi:YeiH family protein [Pseudogracilibacillus sp. SO10305]|uniref:YeiH family protein n=1 Tax=Pseudogracilibacillus sp. SO10305 TaxID=3098292 RepID=UPI00300E15E1